MLVSKINVEFGISQNTNQSTWIKASAGMEIQFDKDDTSEVRQDAWTSAWNRVTGEVSDQLGRVMGGGR